MECRATKRVDQRKSQVENAARHGTKLVSINVKARQREEVRNESAVEIEPAAH